MNAANESEIRRRVAAYCAAAERCTREVRRKIASSGASPETEERIIAWLLEHQFIDEARYCRSFVRDKFRLNHWGRVRIRHELQQKGIAPAVFAEALKEMDDQEYRSVLYAMLKEKKQTSGHGEERETFGRLYRFAAGRGFEHELIVQCLQSLFKSGFDEGEVGDVGEVD